MTALHRLVELGLKAKGNDSRGSTSDGYVRTFFIWLTGILASAIVGGGVGDYLQPYGSGGFWGILFGAFAFTCARLWLAKKKVKSDPNAQADMMCQAMILATRNLGARSPREAAEISRGGPFTDLEWQQHRAPWEQNWIH